MMTMRGFGLSVLLAVPLLAQAAPASAQGVLSVEVINGYNLVVDSNVTAPSTYAPSAAFIGAKVCNTGNASLANVIAHTGDYNSTTPANSTPGVFPETTFGVDLARPHVSGTGDYSLTLEAGDTGAADGTRYIGTLAAGECRVQYWLVTYPQCVNVDGAADYPPCVTSITGGVKPEDDVQVAYDIWATTTTAIAAPTVTVTRDFTLRNEISAAANKIWPNTTAKVPDEYLAAIQQIIGWGTLGPDGQPLTGTNPVYPGQRVITTQGIWYDLGNVGQGFDNDGDLVPDQNAWLQPVGDPSSFDADCFRMVNVYGIVIVKLKSGGELLIPFQNELYHEHLPENTGVVGLVYYQFVATDDGCSASMTPYQEAASGFDNEKFSADFGLQNPLFSGSLPSNIVSKTDGLTSAGPGSTLTYTVSSTNTTGVPLGAPNLGVPLTFKETVPAGTTYVNGSAVNGLTPPAGLGSYTQGYTDVDGTLDTCTLNYQVASSSYVILYSANGGSTWSTTDPGATTTDIQWMLMTTISLDGGHDGSVCLANNGVYDNGTVDTSLPPGQTMSVTFQVTLAGTVGPVVCNTAQLSFGGADSSNTAQDCTIVTGNNSLSGTVFVDDGLGGGIYGNGIKDNLSEAGIGAGVTVTLYYDLNGDGVLDAGDLLYASTATAAGGTYSFSSLPDGPFIVVAKKYDGAEAPGDGLNNAVNDFVAGYGNTTFNPDLSLTTDQGVLKMNEDLTTVTLAVNLDYARNDAGTSVTNANFGFAPPFRLTKTTPATNVDEGDVFTYSILLENRLPSVGRQGPLGCEYTVWGTAGTTGPSAGNKDFLNNTNAYDASTPNRTVASAVVEGGANRWVLANSMALAQKPGNIVKVEGLFFGYFGQTLNNDSLLLYVGRNAAVAGNTGIAGAGNTSTTTIGTALIDSYVGAPADTDPNSAIAWNMTSVRPGGGAWAWTDFVSTLQLQVNPNKAASADGQLFFLDAMGIRVTTDADCEATTSTTLSPVPLQDQFDTNSFTYLSAVPPPTSLSGGTLRWDDVGPITAGSAKTVTVTVQARDVDGMRTGVCGLSAPPAANSACNWAQTDYLTNNVRYADGRLANDDRDSVPVNIQGRAELRGTVWNDGNNDGWPHNDGEIGLPNVTVTLFACVRLTGIVEPDAGNSKTCQTQTTGNTWKVWSTTTTAANGSYEFLGLDSGTYIIEVNDQNGAPNGSQTVYGGAQTAEPSDTQGVSGGNATGTNGVCVGGCNNTWGSTALNLNQMNQLDGGVEETINGIDFGYYLTTAVLYGNIWEDDNANATRDSYEVDLPGFTVQLFTDPNGDGNPADGVVVGTTTSNSAGDYSFSGLAAGSYVIVVTPPTLLTTAWVETHETTGGTGNLNNQIPVTLTSGQFSGSHDFGYTEASTASIGDTVYLDLDGDGVQDPGEVGIPDITVSLYEDVDRDGTIDAGIDTLVGTDVTDANGAYLFDDLAYGSYIVVVDTADADFPTLTTATADPDLFAGSIGDRIWLDNDGNGSLNGSEEGIAGVVVSLYADEDADGALDPGEPAIAATITNVNGNYLFTGLGKGGYFVRIDSTTLPSAALVLTSTNPETNVITLATSTSSHTTADAGYSPSGTAAMGNRVWHDVNRNGTQDAGEVGIAGVDISVAGTGGPFTATTDAAGFWIVTGLTNATYTVTLDTTDLPRDFTITTLTNPRSVAITGLNDRMDVDFGYAYPTETDSPTGSVTGRAYLDLDGDEAYDGLSEALASVTVNLLDSDNNVVATTTTAADGTYRFGSTAGKGVFVGEYSVEVVHPTGTRYSVVFLSPGQAFPNLDVIFDNVIETVADNQGSVSIDGVHDDLRQDFGYQRYRGSIGDTVYYDVNENATQDDGEPGFAGVTVRLHLWNDLDDDGVLDGGELSLLQTVVTTADDPLTLADEGGKYLFPNLDVPPAGQSYHVEVVTSTLPGGSPTLTADPDTDGVPCTLANPVCDSLHTVSAGFSAGINYLGADFGYTITGVPNFAVIGDRLWVDMNANGLYDAGERGISFVTVFVDGDNDNVLDWIDGNANGVWDSGEGERWTQSDIDGYYLFTGLPDGTYDNLKVLTSDADWPPTLPTTPTYEARLANTSLNSSVNVVVSGGVVTSIVDGDPATSDACTDCDLHADFGYRYAGGNTLSGTVCLDDASLLGYCGATDTTYTGTSPDESPLSGIQVFLYQWTDGGTANQAWNGTTGALDPGDSFTLIGSTATDAAGDYSFTNVPDNVVVVLSVSETQNLLLNTTNANSSVEDANVLKRQLFDLRTVNGDGESVTVVARQALNLAGDTDDAVVDLDFAFDSTLGGTLTNDFGDLPDSGVTDYDATLILNGGARHRIGTLYLGAGVTNETDGRDSATASLDANDDGVGLVGMALTQGPDGGSVTITPSQAGWVAGWIDFNRDGDFDDDLEKIVSQSVTAGLQTVSFEVPWDINDGVSGSQTYFARFRIYPEAPLLEAPNGQALSPTFAPTDGEVEDYSWTVAVTRAVIRTFLARDAAGGVAIEWTTASEAGTVGWFLRRWDETVGQFVPVNPRLLPGLMTSPQGGMYRYIDSGATRGTDLSYVLVEVEASGRMHEYGPFRVNTDATVNTPPLVAAGPAAEKLEENVAERGFGSLKRQRPRASAERNGQRSLDAARVRSARTAVSTGAARITVTEPGLHYVSLADLRTMGGMSLPPGWMQPVQKFGLTSNGQPAAFRPASDGTGMLFYGERSASAYSAENVFRLAKVPGKPVRMTARRSPLGARATGAETFVRTVHAEQDAYPATDHFSDPEADYWMWDWVYAGWEVKSFPFRSDGAVRTGKATLTIRLKGATETPGSPDHHAEVRLNGTRIGDVSFNGLDSVEPAFAFDASLLSPDGLNSVVVEGLTDTGAPWSIFFVDSFDVRYASSYRAYEDRFEGRGDRNRVFSVSGFSRADVMVLDVTRPLRPVWVQAPVTRAPDGTYAVTIVPTSPEAKYHVATGGSVVRPRVAPDTPSNLRSAANAADYLVVTTAALAETAQGLADYRTDLRSMVVDIEDVYDEFSHGNATPHALKAFLARTRAWATPPRYVVLAGDGHFDYRDALGWGPNQVPPMMVPTPYGLYASDAWFADLPTGSPLSIGRLPAATSTELAQVIDKVKTREATASEAWQSNLFLMADNGDRVGDFPADAESIAGLANGATLTRGYLPALGTAGTRAAAVDAFNNGTGFFHYYGHGGTDVLADEGLLRATEVAGLTNAQSPAVMTLMTCMAGNFSYGGYPSISEMLVGKPDGGAAAVWGPTAMSEHAQAVPLAESFYTAVFSGEAERVGDAIVSSQLAFRERRAPAYMFWTYALLGDPAMRLR